MGGMGARHALVTVRLRYTGGVAGDSVAASCVPSGQGVGLAAWTGQTSAINSTTGAATLMATGLSPNATYSCTANATKGGQTSSSVSSGEFSTLLPHALETVQGGPGPFPARLLAAGVVFRGAGGGLHLASLGGASLADGTNAMNEIVILNAGESVP
eukprot:tig00021717_g23141.t1